MLLTITLKIKKMNMNNVKIKKTKNPKKQKYMETKIDFIKNLVI